MRPEDLWDAYKDNPSAYIRRRDRLTISECVLADGKLEKPVDESQAQELARVLKKRDYKAIAICLMNSRKSGERTVVERVSAEFTTLSNFHIGRSIA